MLRAPADPLALNTFATETKTIQMEPGDTILFYSDGLTEIFDDRAEMYGQRRLKKVMQGPRRKRPNETVSDIIKDIENFAGKRAMENLQDDVSLIVAHIPASAKFTSEAESA